MNIEIMHLCWHPQIIIDCSSPSVIQRGISFYLQWDVGSSPPVERWCILLSSSSVVRRCTSPSTSSGTLVVHLQWNVGVFCYLHRQWYVDVHLLLPPVGRW